MQKRFNKENGTSNVPSIGSRTRVEHTGNFIDDVSINTAFSLLNGNTSTASIGKNVISTSVPYAINRVKERPVQSVLLALGGLFLGKSFFSSCSTTTTKDKNGKDVVSKTCKEASGLEKSGSAVSAVLLGNYLLDSIYSFNEGQTDTSDTGQTRVRHGSTPPLDPVLMQFTPAN